MLTSDTKTPTPGLPSVEDREGTLSWTQRIAKKIRLLFDDGGIDLHLSGLSDEEIEEIKMMSPYTTRELRRLLARFFALQPDEEKQVTLDKIMTIGEFRVNPLEDRIRSYFESLKHEHIDFAVR